MAVESRHNTTYFIFTKKGRGVGTIMGPLFESEMEGVKEKYFHDKKVTIMEESMFSTFYPERYKKHLSTKWQDKLWCYFQINYGWVGQVSSLADYNGFCGSWFNLYDFIDLNDNDKRKIVVNTIIKANAFYISRLIMEIKEFLPFEIIKGDEYYADSSGKVFTRDRAISVYLGEELCKHMCLN